MAWAISFSKSTQGPGSEGGPGKCHI